MEITESFHKRGLALRLPVETFKSTSEVKVKHTLFALFKRHDAEFCAYLSKLLQNPMIRVIMISTVLVNALFITMETDYNIRFQSHTFLELADVIILAIYTTEFLILFYMDPLNFWRSGYNILNAIILLLAYLPYTINKNNSKYYWTWSTLKGFQVLRILKLINYSRGMMNLMTALGQTMKTVIYVLILLFLLMFIFAILGHGLYGDPDSGDIENWGNLASALFTLFSLVTVDGWTDLQSSLEEHGFTASRAFTIVFILLGFFVFFNMFIGVVIINIQDSTQNYKWECKAEMQAALQAKKQAILKRQQEEVNKLMHQQKTSEYKAFSELVDDFKKTLQHTDTVVLEDFCASIAFIDLYLTSLDLQDDTIYRLQGLYYELANTLNTMLVDMKETAEAAPENQKES
ncbi:PREDICTED: cation channel sperm-associated protein 3 isoform X1 [Gavialis gangeticus]|uniref:cation channel sperm-associated protein 3 isoform X1 n=1 Tax=Gavialis gangeticus TaxID=94835 RepID=UPI00092EA1AE|nr:PREDICTED: cation channel sperm-associated protein 3 isoform X1 [Gavialis gangeticus]